MIAVAAVLNQRYAVAMDGFDRPVVRGEQPVIEDHVAKAKASEVEQALAAVNPDEFSPKQALEFLYEVRRLKS